MDVNDFMARLTANAAPAGGRGTKQFSERRSLEKISLNFPGNFGNYQLFPVNSEVIDYPFVSMPNTREVCVPRHRVNQDGSEEDYTVWIKLLPKDAYVMRDLNNRIVPSLTTEDENLLDAAYSVWDQINEEITKDAVSEDAKKLAYEVKRDLIRKRNYTVFHAYCLNKWDMGNTKSAVRSNFSGLFIATTSAFNSSLKADIDQKSLMYGGTVDFLDEIYSSARTGRTGSLFLTINRPQGQLGFDISFNHTFGVQALASHVIPESDFELMKDPLEAFLGWQANRDAENASVGQRRLFNPFLIKEAISFMTRQLAAIRSAKQMNGDVRSAIEATNQAALAESTAAKAVTTNDPMLREAMEKKAMSDESIKVDAAKLEENNTNPFVTPPAARMDPLSGNPVSVPEVATAPKASSQASAPFSQPGFGMGFGNISTPTPAGFGNESGSDQKLPF